MEEVETGDEDEGDADEQEVVVVDNLTGIPYEEEDRKRNGNSGELDGGMVEDKIILATSQENRDKGTDNEGDQV